MTARVDGPDKVTGRARYAFEHPADGAAYAWAVPSVIARGTIRSVDASQALALPGVLAVITPDNAPRLPGTGDPELALFQTRAVAYRGQFVAAVVAGTLETAREAARLVVIATRFGWAGRDPAPGARREGRWLTGTGVAASTYPARAMPSQARVTVSQAGRYQVSIAAADIGTGARTALLAVAGEALGVFAAGRIVAPAQARSQLIGGMTMGLSMALHEESAMDPQFGDYPNHDLAGYHIAAHADVQDIDAVWIDEEEPELGPAGAKGIGEVGIVGTAAAIAGAVYHATGIRVRDLPIRLDKLLSRKP